MKVRRNEVLVGAAILAALVVLVAGALWLGEVQLGGDRSVHTALFRSVGGLGVGDQVSLRGVRIGRVDAIRLAEDNWVAVDLRLDPDVPLPTGPGAVVMPSTLFGEWEVTVVSRDAPADDPSIARQFAEAAAAHGGDDWPGFQSLIAKARDRGLLVQMGYMFRYQPGFQQVSAWARAGLLGEITSVRAHMSTNIPLRAEPPSANINTREGISRHQGGIFYDLGGHMLDQVVWLLGRPTRASAKPW